MTPMMQQYFEIKDKYREYILMYRLGDFYEMFFDDAKVASAELELTLTGRDCGEAERAPMCGVPYHAVENYIGKLVGKGYKVAICEQLEDPAGAKGIVKRDVIRMITPGTLTESSLLDEKKNNYIAALYVDTEAIGAAFADISTGHISVTSFEGDHRMQKLIGELGAYMPREVLLNVSAAEIPEAAEFLQERLQAVINQNQLLRFHSDAVAPLVYEHFKTVPCEFEDKENPALLATGALL